MARSQPAGNQSRLRYTNSTESVGKTSGAEAAREWLKPLPPTLSDQYSGIVGLLHSSILQFLKLIRPGLPEPTAIDLDEQRKLLLLWRDDKNDIEEIIMRYPNLGIHVISNLADLALVLSQGLRICLPAQNHVYADVHRTFDSVSQILRQELGFQEDCLRSTTLPEFLDLMMSRVTVRVKNLCDLSPILDVSSRQSNSNQLQLAQFCNTKLDDASLPFMPKLMEMFPLASKGLLKRVALANWRRLLATWPNSKTTWDSCSSSTEDSVTSHSPQMACRLCSIEQSDIGDSIDWSEHALAHIRPYTCSFTYCKDGLSIFEDQQEWMEHEFHMHRVKYKWECNSCYSIFDERSSFVEHLHKFHADDVLQHSVEKLRDKSEVILSQPPQDEQCSFCGRDSFITQELFADHVGDHMREIALLIVPFYHSVVGSERNLHNPSGMSGKAGSVLQIQKRMIQPLQAIWRIIKPNTGADEDFDQRIKIYSHVTGKDEVFTLLFDTGSHHNYMSHSIAKGLGLKIEMLEGVPPAEGVNRQKIPYDQYVVPDWSLLDKRCRKSFNDTRFWLLAHTPNDAVIVRTVFINKYNAMSLNLRALVIHNNSFKDPNSIEKERRDIQAHNRNSKRADKKTAIKAERDKVTTGLASKDGVARGKAVKS